MSTGQTGESPKKKEKDKENNGPIYGNGLSKRRGLWYIKMYAFRKNERKTQYGSAGAEERMQRQT